MCQAWRKCFLVVSGLIFLSLDFKVVCSRVTVRWCGFSLYKKGRTCHLDTRGLRKKLSTIHESLPSLGLKVTKQTNWLYKMLLYIQVQSPSSSSTSVSPTLQKRYFLLPTRASTHIFPLRLDMLRTQGRLNTSAMLFSVIVIFLFTFHPLLFCIVTPPSFCHQPGN